MLLVTKQTNKDLKYNIKCIEYSMSNIIQMSNKQILLLIEKAFPIFNFLKIFYQYN